MFQTVHFKSMDELWNGYPENEIPRKKLANYKGVWYFVLRDNKPIYTIYRKIIRNGNEQGVLYVTDSKRSTPSITNEGDEYWEIGGTRSIAPISYSTPNIPFLSSGVILDRLLRINL